MIAVDMASAGRQRVMDLAPVMGKMTVNSKAAVALKAGSSELSGRSYLKVTNVSDTVPCRIGGSAVTWTLGEQLDPGESREIYFDKTVAISIYGVSTGAEAELLVMEA